MLILSKVILSAITISNKLPNTSNYWEVCLDNLLETLLLLFFPSLICVYRYSMILARTSTSMAEWRYPDCLHISVGLFVTVLFSLLTSLKLPGIIITPVAMAIKRAIFDGGISCWSSPFLAAKTAEHNMGFKSLIFLTALKTYFWTMLYRVTPSPSPCHFYIIFAYSKAFIQLLTSLHYSASFQKY